MKSVKDNIQILIVMTVINLIVLWGFNSSGQLLHGIGYFVFFYAAIAIIYLITNKIPPRNEIEIKNPTKELMMAILFSILGFVFLVLNFMQKTGLIPKNIFTTIPILTGVFLFSMPLGITIYLLLKKYRILQLGLTTKPLIYLLLGIVIWGLTGIFAYMFNRSGILWEEAYKELGGVFGMVLQGVIGAGLVEEFNRFVIQSRFEKVFKKLGFNILFATTIWAFMHFPVWYFKSGEVRAIILNCIQIIPLGFVWGYLTQRTKSILPATIAHGFNLWGFQNS